MVILDILSSLKSYQQYTMSYKNDNFCTVHDLGSIVYRIFKSWCISQTRGNIYRLYQYFLNKFPSQNMQAKWYSDKICRVLFTLQHPSFYLECTQQFPLRWPLLHFGTILIILRECLVCSDDPKCLVRWSAKLSSVLTKIIFTVPSSTYSFTYLVLMYTCLVRPVLVMFLDMKTAPTLSTLLITGSLTWIPIVSINLTTKITFLTASDNAYHSASVLDKFKIL